MVTAKKGFSIHRSCNVLTLSLKRFSVFSGEKILKVPQTYQYCDVAVIVNVTWRDYKNVCLLLSGCRISRVLEPATFHVSVPRGTAGVRPVRCAGPLGIQLSHRTLLLLHQGTGHTLDNHSKRTNARLLLSRHSECCPAVFSDRAAMASGTRWTIPPCPSVTSGLFSASRPTCSSTSSKWRRNIYVKKRKIPGWNLFYRTKWSILCLVNLSSVEKEEKNKTNKKDNRLSHYLWVII